MFYGLRVIPANGDLELVGEAFRLMILALSFLALGAFGSLLVAPNDDIRRLSMLGPLFATGLWAFGAFIFKGQYTISAGLLDVIDVWTRYILAIPAAPGLRRAGCAAKRISKSRLAQFGRDS
jgi:hypothetical protein